MSIIERFCNFLNSVIDKIETMSSAHISETKVCESNNDCEVGTICDNEKCTPQFGKDKIKMLR